MQKKISVFILIALLTSGCTIFKGSNVSVPKKPTEEISSIKRSADINVETTKAFAGVRDVVIASFKVGFIEKANVSGNKKGTVLSNKTSVDLTLEGVTEGIKQQITDAAYKDFISRLKAKGYNVVDRSELLENDAFSGVKMYDMPYQNDTSSFISSKGTKTTYFSPRSFGSTSPIFEGEIEGIAGSFAFSNPKLLASQFAAKTHIKVLNVLYTVDFANISGYSGPTSAKINVGQGISVKPGAMLGINGGEDGTLSTNIGKVTTDQPIYSPKEFAEIIDESSETHKTVETISNVIGIIDGGGANTSREYIVKADPEKYRSISLEVLNEANSIFTKKMVSLK